MTRKWSATRSLKPRSKHLNKNDSKPSLRQPQNHLGEIATHIRATGTNLTLILAICHFVACSYAGEKTGDASTGPLLPKAGLASPSAGAAWPPTKTTGESRPLSAEDEQQSFSMPVGYTIELVASEPLVRDPVAIEFDLNGRLWVLEMSGFMPDASRKNSSSALGKIVILEDTDGDGRMDRRSVFLDNLVHARTFKLLIDGVLVGEPPNLWFIQKAPGALKAGERKLLRKDFGIRDGELEHNANGLLWGLDNLLHTSQHTNCFQLNSGSLDAIAMPDHGQWGLSMDDTGRIYRNWNDKPLAVDLVDAHYYSRNPGMVRRRGLFESLIEATNAPVWPTRRTEGVNRAYREGYLRADGTIQQFTAACAPTIFRGDGLPAELLGNAFVAEPAGNLVKRLILFSEPNGSLSARNAYEGREFLASSDERFRPVNFSSGPDGLLYVVDMYRGVIQEGLDQTDYLQDYIHRRNLSFPVGLGRIWRIKHRAFEPKSPPKLAGAAPKKLVELLAHPNGWIRDAVQSILVQRGETFDTTRLKELALTSPDYRTRLHALWTLDGIGKSEPKLLARALTDLSPHVRRAAIQIAERWCARGHRRLTELLLQRIEDESSEVRQQLAATLGDLPKRLRIRGLVQLIQRNPEDTFVVDLAVSGLRKHEVEVLEQLVVPENSAKLDDAIYALSGSASGNGDAASVERMLDMICKSEITNHQQVALLEGIKAGLVNALNQPSATGISRASRYLLIKREPKDLRAFSLRDVSTERGLIEAILRHLRWPGKPREPETTRSLTSEEKTRFDTGHRIFQTICAACHQIDGRGKEGIAASLVESKYVAAFDSEACIRIVLHGKDGAKASMPGFHEAFGDEEISSVLSYLRREWGQGSPLVSPAQVKEVRSMTANRRKPWTDTEIVDLLGELATAR
jgi:mono/diheme cytochrome c family protein/glucose/arabinose dehydrogenase